MIVAPVHLDGAVPRIMDSQCVHGAGFESVDADGYHYRDGCVITREAYAARLAARRGAPEREISEISEISPEPAWPAPLDEEALHGLAGEIVRTCDPHTEADQAAILVQFLAAFANAVGPQPHTLVGGTRHGTRLFAAMVGKTARSRKGDSYQMVAGLLSRADAEWFGACVTTGLSTGEGLISAVRDQGEDDAAAVDRRVLAVETELGRTLRVMARDGNTLSAVLRDAWDGRDLRVMTRGSPLRATGAHVGVIGHITLAELRRELSSTDATNGFANRFIWVCAKRSKELADPPPLAEAVLGRLAGWVREVLNAARQTQALQRDEACRAAWERLYPLLTKDRDGLAGDVLARSEAHVLRLSMVYALLDGSRLILPAHLAAAVAVWDYCQASVLHVFGAASGDVVADEILRHLQTAGELTRTDISGRLGRHVRGDRLRLALEALEQSKRAARRTEGTDGRPVEVWRATGKVVSPAQPLLRTLISHLSLISQSEAA